MKEKELIIPSPQPNSAATKVIVFITMVLGFFLYQSFWIKPFLGHYITFFIQSILIILIILFGIGLIYALFFDDPEEPLAQLNSEGILVKNFGFIKWIDVAEIEPYRVPGTPISLVGIRVRSLANLSKRSSISGKLKIFYSKIFGYPPVSIGSIDISNERIISFAKKFIQEELS